MSQFGHLLGPLSAIASAFTWALAIQYYAKAADRYSPFAVNFFRALFALVFYFVGIFFVTDAWDGLNAHNITWLGLAMVGSYGFGDSVFFWATRSLGVTLPLAVASIYPIWAALGGWIFQGQILTTPQQLGLLVTVVSTVLVILAGRSEVGEGQRKKFALGILLSIMVSVFWSLNSYGVSVGGQGVHLFTANLVRMIAAVVLTSALHGIIRVQKPFLMPMRDLKPLVWVFVMESIGGSLLYLYGLTHSPIAVGSALSSLSPVMAVPLAWAFRRERVSPLKAMGIVGVVIGVVLLVAGKDL